MMIPVKNRYANGKDLGPLEKYNPDNPEHDDPKKYQYYHTGGTVFNHIIEVLKTMDKEGNPLIKLCATLHDIGKGTAFSDTTPGKSYTYYGHDKDAIKLIETIAKRLKMSNKEKEALLYSATQHMKFHKLKEMKPSKIFQIVNDDNFDILVAVARADEFSRGEKFQSSRDFNKSLEMAIKIKEKWGEKKAQKLLNLVSGNRIMELLGIKPGKKVGEIKKKVEDWILNTGNTNEKDIDAYIKEIG